MDHRPNQKRSTSPPVDQNHTVTGKNSLTVLPGASLKEAGAGGSNNPNVITSHGDSNAVSNNSNSLNSTIRPAGSTAKSKQQQPQLHKLRTSDTNNTTGQLRSLTYSSSSLPSHGKSIDSSTPASKSLASLSEQYKNVHIPQFYFPQGRPSDGDSVEGGSSEEVLMKIKEAFSTIEAGKATKSNMGPIAKVYIFFNLLFLIF